MGLDIYLHDGPEVPYEDRDAWKEAFDKTQDTKSATYPDHLCGRRYLRSSYNEAGFNRVVGNLLGDDLYSIFGYSDALCDPYDEEAETGGDWHPTPVQLTAARDRAVKVAERLRAVERPLRAATVSANMFMAPPTVDPSQAIRIAAEQIAKHGPSDAGYGNRDGDFWPSGFTIVAAIPGQEFGRQAFHLVYEADLTWYIAMADIIVEFIDEALSMERPRVVWSG